MNRPRFRSVRHMARRVVARHAIAGALALAGFSFIGAALAVDGLAIVPGTPGDQSNAVLGQHPCQCPDLPGQNCDPTPRFCQSGQIQICCPKLGCVKTLISAPFPEGCFGNSPNSNHTFL